jgi:mitotic-spindle organizing protein 1
MENSGNKNLSHLDVEEARETVESKYNIFKISNVVLYEISQILNCSINRDTLSVLITMIENGANPEALATVVKEMKRENFALGGSK